MLSVALDDIKKNGGTSLKKKYYISISLLMTIIVLVFDQVSKWLITISMKVGDSYEIIPNFLNITSHRNNGAAWGILSGKMLFFYIITIIILIVLVIFYIKEAQFNLFMQVAISLLFAGALGNFIDRVLHGEIRPGIVHRIDKDTSGLLMVAKNDVAHRHLVEQLMSKPSLIQS